MTKSRDKFKELAEKRVIRAIKAIRLVGNLANANNYEYDQDDADKIIASFERELKTLKARFATSGKEKIISFNL